jgi:hypothetical protein
MFLHVKIVKPVGVGRSDRTHRTVLVNILGISKYRRLNGESGC